MVMSFRLSKSVISHFEEALEGKPKGPTFDGLARQAKRALRDREGVNVTKLSRAEREKLLLDL